MVDGADRDNVMSLLFRNPLSLATAYLFPAEPVGNRYAVTAFEFPNGEAGGRIDPLTRRGESMNEAYLLQLLGALVGMFLFTRGVRWVLYRTGSRDPGLAVVSVIIMVAIAVVTAAFGFADGGPLQWEKAFWLYVPTGALVLAFDLVAARGRRAT